jgi:hypothetical protein
MFHHLSVHHLFCFIRHVLAPANSVSIHCQNVVIATNFPGGVRRQSVVSGTCSWLRIIQSTIISVNLTNFLLLKHVQGGDMFRLYGAIINPYLKNRSRSLFSFQYHVLVLFCTMTNKCTIISQIITLLLHVSTLLCHPQGVRR